MKEEQLRKLKQELYHLFGVISIEEIMTNRPLTTHIETLCRLVAKEKF